MCTAWPPIGNDGQHIRPQGITDHQETVRGYMVAVKDGGVIFRCLSADDLNVLELGARPERASFRS